MTLRDDDVLAMALGRVLVYLRVGRSMDQPAVAKFARTTTGTVTRAEQGEYIPGTLMLVRLTAAVGTTPDEALRLARAGVKVALPVFALCPLRAGDTKPWDAILRVSHTALFAALTIDVELAMRGDEPARAAKPGAR